MIDSRFYTLSPAQTLGNIAAKFGADLVPVGAGEEHIISPASLSQSGPGDITFFSDKRRRDQLETAKATACFTTERLSTMVSEKGIIPLITDAPRDHFARLTESMATEGASTPQSSRIDSSANVHPSAVIGEGVEIGARTVISANSVIGDGVVIGADCHIAPLTHVIFTKMGDHCRIKSNSVIGGAGFGVARDSEGAFQIPHLGRVIIKNHVQIGSNTCVDRGQLGDTVLCDHVKIDNLVQIAHNVFIDEGAMLAGHVGISGSCHIGKNCMFGGRAATADHITIGDGAIAAAAAGIMSDIPAGQMWSGVPAMPIREHMRNVAVLKKLAKK